MQCLFTYRADKDLAEIGRFIASDDVSRAMSFVAELRQACRRLTEQPKANPVAVTLDGKRLRRLVFGRYLIFYLVETDRVVIVRVLHGARDIGRILSQP